MATKTKKLGPAKPWQLEIVFEYGQYDEREIERVVGNGRVKYSDGSGVAIFTGERDMEWYFRTERDAKAASARLGRRFRKMSKSVRDIRKDEWYDDEDW